MMRYFFSLNTTPFRSNFINTIFTQRFPFYLNLTNTIYISSARSSIETEKYNK